MQLNQVMNVATKDIEYFTTIMTNVSNGRS